MKFAKPTGHLFEYDNKRAEPLARWLLRAADHPVRSVADIGCGARPRHEWAQRMNRSGDVEYFGVDVDPDAVAALAELGLECLSPEQATARRAEVVLAFEVVEHVPDDEQDDFWSFLAELTEDVLVMTTPNFEGYRNGIVPEEDRREMRYIPDHFKAWDPTSDDPHRHRSAWTAERLHERINTTFDRSVWDHLVYKAWRWTLIDHGTETMFQHHFKLHALVWRKELYRR